MRRTPSARSTSSLANRRPCEAGEPSVSHECSSGIAEHALTNMPTVSLACEAPLKKAFLAAVCARGTYGGRETPRKPGRSSAEVATSTSTRDQLVRLSIANVVKGFSRNTVQRREGSRLRKSWLRGKDTNGQSFSTCLGEFRHSPGKLQMKRVACPRNQILAGRFHTRAARFCLYGPHAVSRQFCPCTVRKTGHAARTYS
jgi:hypothetical protein